MIRTGTAVWVLFGCALVQSLLPVAGILPGMRLPLLLAAVLFFSVHTSCERALWLAVLAGTLHSGLDFAPPGASIAAFVVSALLVNGYRDALDFRTLPVQALLGLIGCMVWTLVFGIICRLSGARPLPLSEWAVRTAWSLCSGLVAVPLLFNHLLIPLMVGERRRH